MTDEEKAELTEAMETLEVRFPGFTEATSLLMDYVHDRKKGIDHEKAMKPLIGVRSEFYMKKWKSMIEKREGREFYE